MTAGVVKARSAAETLKPGTPGQNPQEPATSVSFFKRIVT